MWVSGFFAKNQNQSPLSASQFYKLIVLDLHILFLFDDKRPAPRTSVQESVVADLALSNKSCEKINLRVIGQECIADNSKILDCMQPQGRFIRIFQTIRVYDVVLEFNIGTETFQPIEAYTPITIAAADRILHPEPSASIPKIQANTMWRPGKFHVADNDVLATAKVQIVMMLDHAAIAVKSTVSNKNSFG